jgi:hypothetical protein
MHGAPLFHIPTDALGAGGKISGQGKILLAFFLRTR